jgi:sigma-B regulation protein RsbU (phosphoserine phosphatase)
MELQDFQRCDTLHPVSQTAVLNKRGEAAETQRSFMPPPLYFGQFVQAAAATRPCHAIGGDFFDYADTGREFHVLLGDACGKGTPAALQAALVQGILAADVETGTGAARVVSQLNRTLCRRGMAERFVTLFYGVMTSDHRFTYCNAGHCRPMLVKQSSVRRLSVGGLPPGLFGDARYDEESLYIDAGDTLVVFSDGVSDASNRNQQFGDARIQQIVMEHREGTASAILERVMSGVRDFTHGGRQRDDMAVFVVRYLA